jgi:hypothetical protein
MAILAIILLAAGLSQMELRTGTLFARETLEELYSLVLKFDIFRGVLIILFILAPLYLLVMVRRIRKSGPVEPIVVPRRRTSWVVFFVQAVMWAIAILILRRRLAEGALSFTPPEGADMPGFTFNGAADAVTANVPDWVSYLSSFLLILLVVVIAWVIWKRRQASAGTLEVLAHEAQFALDELQSGEDFRDVILRCYYEMARAVDRHRGLRRKSGMTPREFEVRLVALGLPEQPVCQLTRLFEAVRYGARQMDQTAERQAAECLHAIVAASGGAP